VSGATDVEGRARIDDYAFLSDCQAPALVSREGSVDWWCPPRPDQPPVFGRLLDRRAGHWLLAPAQPARVERRYVPDTLVVESVVTTGEGQVVVTDALATEHGARGHELGLRSPHALVRTVRGVRGRVPMRCEFAPRFEFGLTRPHLEPTSGGVVAEAGSELLRLRSDVPITLDTAGAAAHATFTVGEHQRAGFVVEYRSRHDGTRLPHVDDPDAALTDTVRAWQSWATAHPGYDGLHAAVARRSGIVLQGLTYQPTGAVIAAATTSIPASIGGDANWDYRYAWLRDLSLTGQAQWIAACPDEATRYVSFLADAAGVPTDGARVQIMYAVDGRRRLLEHELPDLDGFAGSRPVRVGNAAWDQAQLDVTGEVLDLAHRYASQLAPLDPRVRALLVHLADEAAATWEQPDAGMWEARDAQRHYLTSKVMCWVALDRAVRMCDLLGAQDRRSCWSATRDQIHRAVLAHGWSDRARAFTGAFGSDHLDASVLLLPLVGFVDASDPQMRATIDAVERELGADGLVYRWDGDTNGFVLCSYWLVECLALAGEVERAQERFEHLGTFCSDLDLWAEQVDPRTGEQTGNFPQAFSHVGMINAAWRLASTTGRVVQPPQAGVRWQPRSDDEEDADHGTTR
jgi:GH15 family glucan-1,4-alpha-glucosidase